MKYLYKQTGLIVESDSELDSTIFALVQEEKPTEKAKKTTTRKRSADNVRKI